MIFKWQAVLHAVRNKAGVLTAAVVVALVVLQTGRHYQAAITERQRHMAAALQAAVRAANFVQHVVNLFDVHVLTVVACAQQCNLRRRKAELPWPVAL